MLPSSVGFTVDDEPTVWEFQLVLYKCAIQVLRYLLLLLSFFWTPFLRSVFYLLLPSHSTHISSFSCIERDTVPWAVGDGSARHEEADSTSAYCPRWSLPYHLYPCQPPTWCCPQSPLLVRCHLPYLCQEGQL